MLKSWKTRVLCQKMFFAFEGNRMRGFLFGVLSFLMVLVDWICMDILLHIYIYFNDDPKSFICHL